MQYLYFSFYGVADLCGDSIIIPELINRFTITQNVNLPLPLQVRQLTIQSANFVNFGNFLRRLQPQNRQSAKLFLQSSRNWDSPNPLARGRVWGRGTLAGERGAGRVQIPTRRGDIYCGTLYMYVYFVTIAIAQTSPSTFIFAAGNKRSVSFFAISVAYCNRII